MIQLSSLAGGTIAVLDLDFETPVGVVVHEKRFYVFDGMEGETIHYSAASGYVVPSGGTELPDVGDLAGLPDVQGLPDL